jgi:small subunit ribosomal protein S18
MEPIQDMPGAEEESAPEGYRGRGSYIRKPRVCQFCIDKMDTIDYKQSDMLRKYVMERGKIRPRRQTGTCTAHQRTLTVAIKRARHMALLPYADE